MQSIRISFFFSCLNFAFLCNTEPKTKAKEAPADPKNKEKGKVAEKAVESNFVRQRNDLRTSSWDEGQLESRRSSFSSRGHFRLTAGRGTDHVKASCRANYWSWFWVGWWSRKGCWTECRRNTSLPNVFRSPRVKKLKRRLSRSRTDWDHRERSPQPLKVAGAGFFRGSFFPTSAAKALLDRGARERKSSFSLDLRESLPLRAP